MTKKITDLEGRLDAAMKRADYIPHTISLTRAELQEEWDKCAALCQRLTEACKTLALERDKSNTLIMTLNLIAMASNDDAYKVDSFRRLISQHYSSVEKSVTNPSK